MNIEDKITLFMSTTFASISLVDFKTLLDIILIVISILNLAFIIICKIIRYMKDGKLTKEEKEDILNDFNTLNDKIKEGVENGRNGQERKSSGK